MPGSKLTSEAMVDKPRERLEDGGGETGSERPRHRILRYVLDASGAVLVAFLLFLGVRSVGVEAFKIPTGSMESTLRVGDFLLVNKAIYGARIPWVGLRIPALREPQRTDVIVFHPPHEPERNYVKRVVGVPGDTLEMREKRLFVNGAPVDEPWAIHVDRNHDAVHPGMRWQRNHLIARAPSAAYAPSRDTWGPIVVPPGRYFVLGDNRDNSEDSRYWGWVERDQIRGRPWFVYYSWDRERARKRGWLEGVRWRRIGDAIR